jgi:hypothetical protein
MTTNSTPEAGAHMRGLIARRATSVCAQDIDGLLADHAEDMVMCAAVHNTVAPILRVLAKRDGPEVREAIEP